jgi:hypothetical protein
MPQTMSGEKIHGIEFAVPFAIQKGAPEDVLPQEISYIDVPEKQKRGLALRELTLKRSHDPRGFWHWLFRKPHTESNEIYYVVVALDLNSDKPFVWPLDPEKADGTWTEIKEGETHMFRLGAGAPVFPPRELTSGVALSILVAESDLEEREAAQHVHDAVKELNSNANVLAFLAGAITDPAGITAVAALEALAKSVEIVSGALAKNGNDNLGAYLAFYPAVGSWAENLEDENEDTKIELVEITE